MTDLTYFATQSVVEQTTVSGTFEELSGWTVDWADLTAKGFANGDDVLVVARFMSDNDTTLQDSYADLQQGSSFPASIIASTVMRNSSVKGHGDEALFIDRVTLATNDNFYFAVKVKTATTTTGRYNDLTFFVFKLDDLVENTDFVYLEDATADPTVDETDHDGVSITLPAASGDDWVFLSTVKWGANGASKKYGTSLVLDGTEVMKNEIEGEGALQRAHFGSVGVLKSAATSAVCKVVYHGQSGGAADYASSVIFALRLNRFANHIAEINTTDQSFGGTTNVYSEVNSASLVLDTTGFVAFFAQTVINSLNSHVNGKPYTQVQHDGTDLVTNLGNYPLRMYDNVSYTAMTTFGDKSLTAATIALTVDAAADDNEGSRNAIDHTLVAFSLELATSDATAPVLTLDSIAETTGPTAVKVDFTSNEAGTTFILRSTNATETKEDVVSTGVDYGAAIAGANSYPIIDWKPGVAEYAHTVVQDAASNISDALHLTVTTTAYADSVVYSGDSVDADSILYVVGGVADSGSGTTLVLAGLVDTDDEYNGMVVNDTTDATEADITDSVAASDTVTFVGGTVDFTGGGHGFNIRLALDAADEIYHEPTIVMSGGTGTFLAYLKFVTGPTYGNTIAVLVTAALANGTYTIAMDTEGVITLTPMSAAFGIIQDLTRDLTQDLTRDIVG